MPQTPRDNGWQRYMRHRRATIEDWDAGRTAQVTAEPRGQSQYNPHDFKSDKEVREFELSCFLHGTRIIDADNKETKYRHFPDRIIGARSGVYTHYAFVECTSGFYHGRPISVQELKRLGVAIND